MQSTSLWSSLHTVNAPTLAQRLGTTPHLSPLLMKARRLGLRTPEDHERLAVRRGLRYYSQPGEIDRLKEEPTDYPVGRKDFPLDVFSNEELSIALLSLSWPFSQNRLRMGAAMLAAAGVSSERLVHLARQERCESVLCHIARCGQKVEPEQSFWPALVDALSEAKTYPPDVLPHLTRFVAMTGFTRRGKETVMQWIRPQTVCS